MPFVPDITSEGRLYVTGDHLKKIKNIYFTTFPASS